MMKIEIKDDKLQLAESCLSCPNNCCTEQPHPTFSIHSKYIHYIDIEYDEDEEYSDSFYYPYFIEKEKLLEILNRVFTNIYWKFPSEFGI